MLVYLETLFLREKHLMEQFIYVELKTKRVSSDVIWFSHNEKIWKFKLI